MITVEEAKELILNAVDKQEVVKMGIAEASGHFLASDIVSPVSLPLFNQSAMDGYAFKFENVNEQMTVVDEVPAGEIRAIQTETGEAVRIFTGAKVPDSCDTVVMQELTKVEGDALRVHDEGLKPGGNIRKKGSQIMKGDMAMKKGEKLTAAAIGFLASLGVDEVQVYKKPTVAIIATGSELIKPGNQLQEGQIFESNTYMLEAALLKLDIQPKIIVVKDDESETRNAIATCLNEVDMLVLSGGISVGDYDYVKDALTVEGVNDVFYKIKQKPGKPLYFGKCDKKLVFALPGNPAAALSCFYEYVLPSINLLMGIEEDPFLSKIKLPLRNSFRKKPGRANFLKGNTDLKSVEILDGQTSDVLRSFSVANCLVYIPGDVESVEAGDICEIHLLPV